MAHTAYSRAKKNEVYNLGLFALHYHIKKTINVRDKLIKKETIPIWRKL